VEIEQLRTPSLRLRVGLGAGVVLVLVLAGIAVIVSALSPHGSTATAAQPVSRSRTVHTQGPSGGDSPTAYVHVVGQVNSPGLYELPAGSRIVDAVAAAGGFTATADQTQLNLAQVIEDGQQIVVLAEGAVPAASAAPAGAGGTVDINTADATGLETLDGIGPSLAARILAYRTAHGGFRTINDLQNVTGIGPKKFAAIKASVST
jgi:competence protein ComEA